MNALDKTRTETSARLRLPRCVSVPVVHPPIMEPGNGMLTERQLTWLHEFPNETTTENPVLYK